MRYIRVLILIVIAISLLNTSNANTTNEINFAENNNKFTINFFKQLLNDEENKNKNIIFSPFSIQTAGGLLYAGSNGVTSEEILQGFNLPGYDKETVSNSFTKFFDQNTELLNSNTLNIANKIYIMDGFTIKPTYKDIVTNSYHASIESIQFSDSNNSANIINEWIEKNTGGKIKDLVKSDSFDVTTRMYLVNAIYFKTEWEDKFDPELTIERDFFKTPQDKIPLQMMSKTGQIEYKNYFDISAMGVNLNFKDTNLSLFILMPQYIETPLTDLEDKLDNLNLLDIFNEVSETTAAISLPKFKIELEIDLKKILQELNITTMFDFTRADFNNLLETTEQLSVSDATHKAFMEVNEEGAEGGGATGVGITSRMGPMIININRPFLYFIKSSDGEIYFMGRFTGQ